MSGSTTLQVDRHAREVFGEAGIATSRADAALALEVCKKLVGIEPHYRLALRCGDHESASGNSTESASERRSARGSGRRLSARFPGRCDSCGQAITVGNPILYDSETKRATHERCAS